VKENGSEQNAQRDTNNDAKGQFAAGSEIEEWELHGVSVALFRGSVKRRKSRLPPNGGRRKNNRQPRSV